MSGRETVEHAIDSIPDMLILQKEMRASLAVAQVNMDALRARIAELEAHCDRLGRGGAERYWEERWRDENARNADLAAALQAFLDYGDARVHRDRARTLLAKELPHEGTDDQADPATPTPGSATDPQKHPTPEGTQG